MKIPLNELSTQGLVRLIADASRELQARLSAPVEVRLHNGRPVHTLRVPAEDDADFVLMIAARIRAGGYVKAAERERVAQIAQEFGEWVKRQGLPTSHNAGDWKRRSEACTAPRAKEK